MMEDTNRKPEGQRHLAGPWDASHGIVRPKGSRDGQVFSGYVPVFAHQKAKGGTANVLIATVNGRNDEELLGNALLIGAAPQMLEGCEKAMAIFNRMVNADPDNAELHELVKDAWHAVSHAYSRATSAPYADLNEWDGNEKTARG